MRADAPDWCEKTLGCVLSGGHGGPCTHDYETDLELLGKAPDNTSWTPDTSEGI